MLTKMIDFLKNLPESADTLKILQKFLKRLSNLINNSIANGVDTAYTPIRVAYWFGHEKLQFLWSTPGIIGSSAVTLLFAGIFIAKDQYKEKRRKQLYRYSFVAKTLTKRFNEELERDTWHHQVFKPQHWRAFEFWYQSCPESVNRLFRQLLQVQTDEEVVALIKQAFDKKPSFTIKDILQWLPEYLHHTLGETATTKFTSNSLILDDDEDDEGESAYSPIPEKSTLQRIFGFLKRFFGFFKDFMWDPANKYTMGYWIIRAIATIFKQPKELKGSLTSNHPLIFGLPAIGVAISLIYLGIKKIRKHWVSPQAQGYQPLANDDSSNATPYHFKLDKVKTKKRNIKYFEQQLADLLKLKSALQQHQIHYELNRLRNVTSINFFKIKSTMEETDQVSQQIDKQAASFPQPQKKVTVESIIANSMRKNTWLSGLKSKTFATGVGVGVGIFACCSFIVWVLSELLSYAQLPMAVWNFSIFTGTGLDLIGTALSIIIGIGFGIHAAYNAYKNHQEIKQKFEQTANLEVKDSYFERPVPLFKLIAHKQNHLNQLKKELLVAKKLEDNAITNYNDNVKAQRLNKSFLLYQQDWQTNIPDFINKFDAINYTRFNDTLSFKTSVKTYVKKALNRGLALLMGGITGSLVPRILFGTLKVFAPAVSLYALFTLNLPLAIVLTTVFAASIVFFAAIRLWNYHLDRVKESQQTCLEMLTPSATLQQAPVQERLNQQIKLCQQLKQQSAEKIVFINKATKKLANINTVKAIPTKHTNNGLNSTENHGTNSQVIELVEKNAPLVIQPAANIRHYSPEPAMNATTPMTPNTPSANVSNTGMFGLRNRHTNESVIDDNKIGLARRPYASELFSPL